MNIFQYTPHFIFSATCAMYRAEKPILPPETMHFWSAVTECPVNMRRESYCCDKCWVTFRNSSRGLDFLLSTKRIMAFGNEIVEEQLSNILNTNPLISISFFLLENSWIWNKLAFVAQTCSGICYYWYDFNFSKLNMNHKERRPCNTFTHQFWKYNDVPGKHLTITSLKNCLRKHYIVLVLCGTFPP